MMDVTRGDRGEVVIRVEGIFDRNAATRLARALCDLPAAASLVLDFTQADDLQDLCVAAMAKELAGHPRMALRGLGRHHLRLLRYCGVELPAAPAVDVDEEARD
jgi:hypothetical protein